MKSTRSGEVGLTAGSEGDSAGTVGCCGDDVEILRDQNEGFRTRGVEGELPPVAQCEVEARFAVGNICVTEIPLVRCCSSFDEGFSGRNECVLLLFRRTLSMLLFGKDVNATELI